MKQQQHQHDGAHRQHPQHSNSWTAQHIPGSTSGIALPSCTSPTTLALGATKTLLPSAGRLPPNACTLCALFTAGGQRAERGGGQAAGERRRAGQGLAGCCAALAVPIMPSDPPELLTGLLVGHAALQGAAQALKGLAQPPQGAA